MRLFILPLANEARSAYAFRITSKGLATAMRTLRRRRLLLAGFFHTHPTLGPEPSLLDRHWMSRFPLWWLIYSPSGGRVRMVRARANRVERALVRVG